MRSAPFSLRDPGAIYNEVGNSARAVYADVSAKSLRSLTINTAVRNLFLFIPGQSLNTGLSPTNYTPTNGANIDNFLWTSGLNYAASDPLVGTHWNGAAASTSANYNLRVADGMISNGKFSRVIIVPCALAGTSIAQWTNDYVADPNGYYRVLNAAAKKLAARGITPATTNCFFAVKWNQGESDTQAGTSQTDYYNGLLRLRALCPDLVGAKWFVAQESYIAGVSSAAVRAAQAAIVDNVNWFSGGDMDTITDAGRQADRTHLNDAGAVSAATIGINALSAVY